MNVLTSSNNESIKIFVQFRPNFLYLSRNSDIRISVIINYNTSLLQLN